MHAADDPTEKFAQSIGRELRSPVELSPDLDDRIMKEVRRRARRSRMRPLFLWGGLAAAALMAIAVGMTTRSARLTVPPMERVAFGLEAPAATRVTLVGDFNNWDPDATPLVRSEHGRWETVVPLEPGRYQFTFVVDGSRWVRDPRLPAAVGEDFGEPTSVITIIPVSRL
ncbi:MAG: isoamylase early set domain-containing protein [Gemmatimonadota bacterium]